MRDNKGFFLVEIAIVILLIGVAVSAFTRIIKASVTITKYTLEKTNREIIVSALASYVIKNKRLPKPSINFNGLESDIESNNKILIGKVPFKTIDILQSNSLDSEKKPMIYVVINECTKTSKIFNNEFNSILDTSDNCFEDVDCSYIKIRTNQVFEENICFVILPERVFKKNTTQKDNKFVVSEPTQNITALTKTVFLNHNCQLRKS